MNRKLRTNQREALKYARLTDHPALFLEMRLGKTLVTIRRVKQYSHCRKIIVFCPYEAMQGWEDDLTLEGESFTLIVGSGAQRKQMVTRLNFNHGRHWCITNLQAHLTIGEELAVLDWDVVILDESSCIRHPQTAITHYFTTNFRDVDHRFILSGLPNPESELDFFCQLQFLDPDIWNESNYYEFEHNHFGSIGYEKLISPGGSKYLSHKLAKNCLFQSRHDYDLGGIMVFERRYVKLPSSVQRIYDRAEKELILRYKNIEEQTIYQTTKRIWLRRLCGGFADKELMTDCKAKQLKYLLNTELKREQVIVTAFFRAEVDYLYNYFKHSCKCAALHGKVPPLKRKEIVKQFKQGKLDRLFVQPDCLRFGANLSFCDTIVTYSLPEKYETYQQFINRIVDAGSSKTTLILHLITEDTLEESMVESLILKEGRALRTKRDAQRLAKKYGTK